jgi:hypothetical protein
LGAEGNISLSFLIRFTREITRQIEIPLRAQNSTQWKTCFSRKPALCMTRFTLRRLSMKVIDATVYMLLRIANFSNFAYSSTGTSRKNTCHHLEAKVIHSFYCNIAVKSVKFMITFHDVAIPEYEFPNYGYIRITLAFIARFVFKSLGVKLKIYKFC